MRIGLIALSGVRALDPELDALGLTLPGFVERRKVVASMPSLSLLTLAALTPADVEVEYLEVRDLSEADSLPDRFDLVALSSFSAQALDAYELARRFAARGVPTVMGGLHATSVPREVQRHCTSVAIGEGELTWPTIVEDARAGRLAPSYAPPPGVWHDLAKSPVPRYDLLDVSRYNRITVQTSRGCPHRCDFCASSILLTPKYRVKPVENVIAEIRRIKESWPQPFLELADDNSFVLRDHARDLLRALAAEDVKWFTEADISIADDPELLQLMRDSGCRQVLIGLESPISTGLDGLEMRRNWKLKRQPSAEAAIRRIQAHGITVNGCFILGLDGHDESVFEEVRAFVDRTGLYEVQVTLLTPFPGTPLHERLKREGRLLDDGNWRRCTLFDVAFVPKNMSPARLRRGLVELCGQLYSPEAVRTRRERFFHELRRSRHAGSRMEEEHAALAE